MSMTMGSLNVRALLAAAVAGIGVGATAQAAEFTWQPTAGGTFHWPTTTQNNWGTGVGGAYPGSSGSPSGDIANINIDITGNQTIELREPINIAVLNVGDATGGQTVTFSNGTGTQTLTFESATPGGTALLNIIAGDGTQQHTFNADIAVGGSSSLTIDFQGTQRIRTNGTFDTGTTSNAITITGTNTGNNVAWLVHGDLAGSGTIIKNSTGTMEFGSTVKTKSFTGTIILNNGIGGTNSGSLTLINGSAANAAEIIVNGATGYDGSLRQYGGTLWSGSNGGTGENPGQRLTQHKITLNGGTLGTVGQAVSLNASGTPWQQGLEPTHDDVATLRFNSGYSQWAAGAGNNSPGTEVHVTSLQRGAGATVYLRGPAYADWVARISLTADNLAADLAAADGSGQLKGGFGAAGSKTVSIIPWMGAYYSGNTGGPSGFATYTASGLRALNIDTEYATAIVSGTNTLENVSTNSVAISSATTINSLRFTGSSSNIGAGQVLTVASGGVFFVSNNGTIGQVEDADAGTLNFGSAEGVVWVNASNTNTIGAAITGTGGLTKAGTGTLILAGANAYSGDTHASGGTLRVGNGTVASTLGDGDVYVHNGALLDILSDDVIADEAKLVLHAYGLLNGQVSVGDGLLEIVGGLVLGDQTMPAGYYGSSAAAAANPDLGLVVNDVFFVGSGVIQVVPEPSAVALLGLALPLAMRRRVRKIASCQARQ